VYWRIQPSVLSVIPAILHAIITVHYFDNLDVTPIACDAVGWRQGSAPDKLLFVGAQYVLRAGCEYPLHGSADQACEIS
jgi:hypothetical protein